jgi:hypothetical protein
MKKKSIIISEATHSMIKDYCEKNSLKIHEWIDKLLRKNLEKLNGNLQNNKSN